MGKRNPKNSSIYEPEHRFVADDKPDVRNNSTQKISSTQTTSLNSRVRQISNSTINSGPAVKTEKPKIEIHENKIKENKSNLASEQKRPADKKVEIFVDHITMDFKRDVDEPSSVKEAFIKRLKGKRQVEYFRALDNITFTVNQGEVLGLIGINGAGKSTLLKVISGALLPTKGKIEIDREKVQLLTLGTGFDRELTGRENVFLNGAIIGYPKEYIERKFDEIVAFAELEDFIDEKVKNYSSGMISRLGFAIATCRKTPGILILDEVLSVGDEFFRVKSLKKVREMIHSGSTVILVSHNMNTIRANCDKVVWLDKGRVRMVGRTDEVCRAYHNQYGTQDEPNAKKQKTKDENKKSTGAYLKQIDHVWYCFIDGNLNKEYEGLAKNAHGWWYVRNGQIDFSHTGIANNQHGTWAVKDGRVIRDVNGIERIGNTTAYFVNGRIDKSKNGILNHGDKKYHLKNGIVISIS